MTLSELLLIWTPLPRLGKREQAQGVGADETADDRVAVGAAHFDAVAQVAADDREEVGSGRADRGRRRCRHQDTRPPWRCRRRSSRSRSVPM